MVVFHTVRRVAGSQDPGPPPSRLLVALTGSSRFVSLPPPREPLSRPGGTMTDLGVMTGTEDRGKVGAQQERTQGNDGKNGRRMGGTAEEAGRQ